MVRMGIVYYGKTRAGEIRETETGYEFSYDAEYLKRDNACAISFTLPLTEEIFRTRTMLPFFDGLIPEGWLLEIAEKNWKLNHRDRMGLLLTVCRDTIGCVTVVDASEVDPSEEESLEEGAL